MNTAPYAPTYSTDQIAAMLDMSSRWVQQQAHLNEIGQIVGNCRRYSPGDLKKLRKLVNKDETRGRPRVNGSPTSNAHSLRGI